MARFHIGHLLVNGIYRKWQPGGRNTPGRIDARFLTAEQDRIGLRTGSHRDARRTRSCPLASGCLRKVPKGKRSRVSYSNNNSLTECMRSTNMWSFTRVATKGAGNASCAFSLVARCFLTNFQLTTRVSASNSVVWASCSRQPAHTLHLCCGKLGEVLAGVSERFVSRCLRHQPRELQFMQFELQFRACIEWAMAVKLELAFKSRVPQL